MMKNIKIITLAALLSALPFVSQATEQACHTPFNQLAGDEISATGSTTLIPLSHQLEKRSQSVNCPVSAISAGGQNTPVRNDSLYH